MSSPTFTPAPADAAPVPDASLVKTLHDKRDESARVAVLAVLAKAHGDHTAAYRALATSRRREVRSYLSEKAWSAITADSDSYTGSSSMAVRAGVAKRFVYNVLRPLKIDGVPLTPARARKAKSVVAAAAILSLTDGRNYDSALLNQSDLAAVWGVSRAAVRNAIALAVAAGVISRVTGTDKKSNAVGHGIIHRYRLTAAPGWWTAPEGTVELLAEGTSFDELGEWLMSGLHAGWWHSDIRSADMWLRMVETAAGQRKPTRSTTALILAGVSELDLDLDAVERGAVAAEKRDAERLTAWVAKTIFGPLKKAGGYPAPGEYLQPFAQAMVKHLATTEPAIRPHLLIHIEEGLAEHPPDKVALLMDDLQKGLS